jgi:hypothetical protein
MTRSTDNVNSLLAAVAARDAIADGLQRLSHTSFGGGSR